VKTQSLFYTLAITVILPLTSCINAESSGLENPGSPNQKKDTKYKLSAKKHKKKSNLVKKTRTASLTVAPPAKDKDSKKEKEIIAPSPNMVLLNVFAKNVKSYAVQNRYSTKYCFLVDMSMPSGANRFFVYDLEKNSVVYSGLVAHGSCNENFRTGPKFSNGLNTGCSSLGKYKIGELYNGKYGKSYRLYGLDNSNSTAYKRGVVIHPYNCVPDKEIYPAVLCNSFGCPMVSNTFFGKLSQIISKADKPILLWIFS
jgi:hypothetical protein